MFSKQSDRLSSESSGTLRGCVESFLQHEGERGLLAKSLREMRRYLGSFVRWCEEHGVNSAGVIDASLLGDFLLASNFEKKQASCKGMVWSLQNFGSYLVVRGILAENPAKAFRYPRLPALHTIPTYLQEHQLRSLLKASAASGDFVELLVISLLTSLGLRSFEVASLTPQSYRADIDMLSFKAKGGCPHRLPVPTSLATLLGAHLTTLSSGASFLFQTRRGTPVDAGWVRRVTAKAGERIDLPYTLTPRILRHSFATHAADRHGVVITKRLLGHRYLNTTGVYTHLSPRRFRRLMNLHPYTATYRRTHGRA